MAFNVSGLGSGIDWQSILDKYREVENNRIALLTNQKTSASNKLSAWNTFGTKLTSLQTASSDLKNAGAFSLFSTSLASSSTVSADSLLSATASSSAAKGTYQLIVNNRAQVQKLGSGSFTSKTTALNISGTILVNGKAVSISSADTLQDLSTKINTVNTGTSPSNVTSSILQESPTSFRLVLTSGTEGAAGISLQNGSSSDILGAAGLGFNASGTEVRHSVTGGAQSDVFSSASTAVETLLGISSQALSGDVVIDGKTVNIDLSNSLTKIASDLSLAGVNAKVVSNAKGDQNYLQIEGMNSWTDQNNVLQALGVVQGSRGDIVGVKSSVGNTTDGSAAITSATKISDIYGYLANTAGDKITISGMTHGGATVAATDLSIDGATTVGDLLTQIQNLFGNVTASISSDGKIQVVDNDTGTSQLSVSLQTTLMGANAGKLDFGTFGTVGAVSKYVVQQGQDASFSIDGVAMTSSTNTVTTAIPGVTLKLLGEDSDTTVTVNVDRDNKGIEDKVNAMLTALNDAVGFVNTQMTYDSATKKAGGPLFGNNSLKAIKVQLQNLIQQKVGNGTYSYLSQIGVQIGSDGKYTLDSTTFESALSTNFNDVVNLLSDSGAGTNSSFQFSYSGRATVAGTYAINITQPPLAGTIDGFAATVNGNVLSLSNSASGANGLAVTYTGTSASDTTSFTLSRGIASLIDSAIYSMTDASNGQLTLQQNASQSVIDSVNSKITNTQDQIDQKMAQLQKQFEAMDAAVTKVQSMASYLSQQFK